ncbi:ankyrin repeat domain-containing protein [Pasteurella sp. PK-2025]|uniref:ankyrin repeat domain-containing protein n=2 Tax=Pasteurella sp. PK-2025 TaxID=3413133 RepID=UPI003C734F4E
MKRFFFIFMLCIGLGGCMDNSYPLDGFSEEQKVLVKAIKAADVEKVKSLAKVTDLELKSEQSIPILTAAMFEAMGDLKSDKPTRHLQVITELVRAGAPVDKRGDFGETPLSLALMQEHPALLRAMLEGGLDPNFRIQNSHSGTPIMFRVLSNYKLESVKLLVKYGADMDLMLSNGETLAHEAITVAPQVAYYLVSIGATIHSKNKFTGKTFAMSVFNEEKSLKEDVDDVKSGRYKGNLEVIQGDLDAVQKIKAIMIEKGIEWPPKQ